MKFISLETGIKELPVKVMLSLEPLFEEVARNARDDNHPYSKSSKQILEKISQFPELKTGISDFSKLDKYEEVIDFLFKPLFPEVLQTNEIKAVVLPFSYKAFYPTKRLSAILDNAGADFRLSLDGFNIEKAYLFACSYILAKYYGQPILKISRPIYLDIPNLKTGQMHHYRALFNADFIEVFKTEKAPELTQKDIEELLVNGEDLDLWKEKFPPGSYIMKGFGLMNMFDATQDVVISNTTSLFLRKDEAIFSDFQHNIRSLFGINDLQVGISLYNTRTRRSMGSFYNKETRSLFMHNGEEVDYRTVFCDGIHSCVIENSKIFSVADVELYGARTNQNLFYKKFIKKELRVLYWFPCR